MRQKLKDDKEICCHDAACVHQDFQGCFEKQKRKAEQSPRDLTGAEDAAEAWRSWRPGEGGRGGRGGHGGVEAEMRITPTVQARRQKGRGDRRRNRSRATSPGRSPKKSVLEVQ